LSTEPTTLKSNQEPGAVAEAGYESSPATLSIPDKFVRRILIAIVVVAACAELSYTTVNISAMPVFIRSIHLEDRWIALAAASFILFEGVLKSPFGVLGDRIGRKPLIMTGPAVSIVTCLLTPHIHNPYLLILLRILDGVGAAALWPSAFSLIGDYVPERRRATAMSFFNLAYLLGLALGPILGGGVNDWCFRHLAITFNQSKEASFYVASVLFLITTLVAGVCIPHIRDVPHAHPTVGESGLDLNSFRSMLSRMPMHLLMTFTTFSGIGLIMTYVKIFTLETFHLSETHFGALLIGPALIIASLSVPLGTTGDRIGKAKAVKLGIGLCALSYWILLSHFQEWSLIVFGSLLGIGFIIAFPAWMALVSSICGTSQRGAAIGAVGTAQGVGAILGVVISSKLYELPAMQIGPIPVPAHGLPFLACGIMLAISFLLAMTTVRDPVSGAPLGECATD